MKTNRVRYVIGSKGHYKIQIFVMHPSFCVCATCPEKRQPDEWEKEFPVRIQRKSIFPNDALDSSAYARQVKRDEEDRLRRAVLAAEKKGNAVGNSVSVGQLCDAYRNYQLEQGNRTSSDKHRINYIEKFFGKNTDAQKVTRADYNRFREELEQTKKRTLATSLRYTNTLLAIFNNGLKEEDLNFREHGLKHLKRPRVRNREKPVTFMEEQVNVLLGPAMIKYEREQGDWLRSVEASGKDENLAQVSYVPLRGFCLVAYLTLMRPINNLNLHWSQLVIGPGEDEGRFRLDDHKNSSRGVNVESALHPLLIRYLKAIMPSDHPAGPVHPNPKTGLPYISFVKQWKRLIEIANSILPPDQKLTGWRTHFYTWRHTGASRMAAHGIDPIKIVRMMGDTSLTTVMKHYFDSTVEEMAASIRDWTPFREPQEKEQLDLNPN
ncbi:MAG TPA: tyrosine-type recombinase/integrase [Thermoanaerobaculia bacterium]|nr:tyrosine-type recombinase/integrase [Thermoanaerobaculia bacterium]